MRGSIVFAALFLLLLAAFATADDVVLVQEGKPVASIVLPAHSLPAERRGADELRLYFKEISGASLPVITDDQPLPESAILVGRGKYTDQLAVKLDANSLGEDGFVLKTIGRRLIIAGPGKRGSMYGCNALLERLGVRWFTPTVTRFPHDANITIGQLDETQVPAFEYRDVSFTEAQNGDWAARLALNGQTAALDITAGGKVVYYPFVHSFDDLIPRAWYSRRPDFFPLINGKRTDGYVQRCLSNPDVLKLTIARVREWMAQHPEAQIYSVSQNDTYNFCQCDKCTAIANRYGGQSGLYVWFVNQVAEAVEKEHPDKLIDTLAYQFTEAPPKGIVPRKNVRVRLCPIAICAAHPLEQCSHRADKAFLEHFRGWGELTDQLYIWHYATDFRHYLLPFPDFRELTADMRLYKKSGVKGVFVEGAYGAGGGGSDAELRSYVLAHLLWDPGRDTDAMVTEWMQGVYGKAWQPMRQWFDLLHENAANPAYHFSFFEQPKGVAYLNGDVLEKGAQLFSSAEKLAEGDAVAQEYVAKSKLWLRYAQFARNPSPDALTGLTSDLRQRGIRNIGEHQSVEEWENPLRAKLAK